MLALVWKAEHAGAPNDQRYRGANDRLYLRGFSGDRFSDTEIQTFQKAADPPYGPAPGLTKAVGDWLGWRGGGKVVVLVHGYSFNPGAPDRPDFDDDPFNGVYARASNGASWVELFGVENVVGYAWASGPSFAQAADACWNNPYEYAVQDLAVLAARGLAATIVALADAGVTVDLFAHSLGTRVAMRAVDLLRRQGRPTAVRRAVMLGGAEYSIDARLAVFRTGIEVFNFVARRDLVLKWGATQLGGRQRLPATDEARVIGRDGMARDGRWIDFQLDHSDDDTREAFDQWFDRLGYRLSGAPTGGRGHHWAYYLHASNRGLFRLLLADDGPSIAWFRERKVPDGVDRFRYGMMSGPVPKRLMTCAQRKQLYR